MRLNEIKLTEGKAIIDMDSKHKCICKEEIWIGMKDEKKILLELTGLAEWSEHQCQK